MREYNIGESIKHMETIDNVGEKMDKDDEFRDDYDHCYECTGYGDNYSFDDDGELVCNCGDCPYNQVWHDDDEID